MFYEPKTLIVVYKDEMLANQIKNTKTSAGGTWFSKKGAAATRVSRFLCKIR